MLRARFADALYFYNQDLQRPLADLVPALEQLTFLEGLGSLLDKTRRLEPSAPSIASALGLRYRQAARRAPLTWRRPTLLPDWSAS